MSGILPRAARHWGVDSSAIDYPLGAPGRAPLYLCHPPTGALQVVPVIFPVLVGLFMEKTKNKCLNRSRDTVVHKYVPSFAPLGVSQSHIPPKGAGTPSKSIDIKHLK